MAHLIVDAVINHCLTAMKRAGNYRETQTPSFWSIGFFFNGAWICRKYLLVADLRDFKGRRKPRGRFVARSTRHWNFPFFNKTKNSSLQKSKSFSFQLISRLRKEWNCFTDISSRFRFQKASSPHRLRQIWSGAWEFFWQLERSAVCARKKSDLFPFILFHRIILRNSYLAMIQNQNKISHSYWGNKFFSHSLVS